MNPATTARQTLDLLLPEWHTLLQGWAASGELVAAAREALQLSATPAALSKLVKQWAAGVFEALPPIVLFPASSMSGAAAAYAISTGTIYLNADWLVQASAQQAMAVLTEELGHHLDAQLNSADSPGDEGELFATLLLEPAALGGAQQEALRQQDDHASLPLAGPDASPLAVELAGGTLGYQVLSTPIPAASPSRSRQERRNQYAFAALRSDGSVVTWGDSSGGGNSSGVDFDGPANNLTITQIFSTLSAFAALRSDGSVVTWGDSSWGGNSSGVDFDGPTNNLAITQIFSNSHAFAALRSDGSVVTWGDPFWGGNSSGVDFDGPANNLTVTQIFSTPSAFAALRSDGSVVTWGLADSGGNSSSVDFNGLANNLTITQIFSTLGAFAALRSDGSVVTWGDFSRGGNSSGVDFDGPTNNLAITQIFSNDYAFAALRSDGSVVTWGDSSWGGNSSGVDFDGPTNNLAITQIFSNSYAFAALRSDGSVVTWGDPFWGGNSSGVDFDGPANNLTVTQIFSNSTAFAAVRSNGSVVTWGDTRYGGNSSGVDFDGPANNLTLTQLFSSYFAFAALLSDGSIVTWGDSSVGGNSSGVDFDGPANSLSVSQIFSTGYAFAALINNGTVVTWGQTEYGGNSNGVDFDGPLNDLKVVGFANPFTDDRLVFDTSIDPQPIITVDVTPASVAEDSDSNLIYTFTRTGDPSAPLTVSYTVGGTASGNGDGGAFASNSDGGIFSGNSGFSSTRDYSGISDESYVKSVSFAAGATTTTVTIDPIADSIVEPDETVALVLMAADGYAIGTIDAVVGTIRDDDLPSASLTVSPESVLEDGDSNLIYTFTRTGDPSAPLTVSYAVGGTASGNGDGGAFAGNSDGGILTGNSCFGSTRDYSGINDSPNPYVRTVSFAAGAVTSTVTIDPIADSVVELDETVTLMLLAGDGYAIGTTDAVVGTIRDDEADPIITLRVSPEVVLEEGNSNLIYTFSRTGPVTSALTVNYLIAGSATIGADYTGIQVGETIKTVSFEAGFAIATVIVEPIADDNIEPIETVALTLAPSTGYSIGTAIPVVGRITASELGVLRPVADIQPGSGSVTNLVAIGNTLYFSADDGISGAELWKSDGTSARRTQKGLG